MALLNRFLQLLELLEQAVAVVNDLPLPLAIATMAALLGYQSLLLAGGEPLSAALLATALALTLHCGMNHPEV